MPVSGSRQPAKSLAALLFATLLTSIAAFGVTATAAGSAPVQPQQTTAEHISTSASCTRFGLSLLKGLTAKKGKNPLNMCICPLSIHMCLQLAYDGAGGATQKELAQVMEYGKKSQSEVDSGYKELMKSLEASQTQNKFTLNVANSLWGNEGVTFKPDYVSLLKTSYHGEATSLDFKDPDSVGKINAWVAEKTKNKITSILDNLDPQTAFVLVNAAYFKALWDQQFHSAVTTDEPFFTGRGKKKTVKMMHSDPETSYLEDAKTQVVTLDYSGYTYAMVIMLPKSGNSVNSLITSLDEKKWQELTRQNERRTVRLSLPRFKMDCNYQLLEILSAMGLKRACSPGADFGAMTPDTHAYIGAVIHKTFIETNESGTEAAAVTAIPAPGGMPMENKPVTMTVDHPFLFAVIDCSSADRMPLFIGVVSDP